jgi:hypothetical protein
MSLLFDCKRCQGHFHSMTWQEPEGFVCLACAAEIRHDIKHEVTLNTGLPCHPSETTVVFRDARGNLRHPGRNDALTPPGFERIELRNIRHLEKHSKEHGFTSEVLNYDRGTGRSFPTGHPDDPLY